MAAFTTANAAEMARKALAARALNRLKPVQAQIDNPQTTLPVASNAADVYLAKRLLRVRAQIELLNKLLESEGDANKIDRLVSAIYRLTELERVIANRPLPGSLRPSSKPTRQPVVNRAEPIDLPPDSHAPGPYLGPENG